MLQALLRALNYKDFFTVTEEQKRQNALNEVNKIFKVILIAAVGTYF